MKEKTSVIKNNLYFIKMLWKISPARVVLNLLIEILGYTSWVFGSVIFVGYIFGDGALTRGFTKTAIFIVVAALFDISVTCIMNLFYNLYLPKNDLKIHYRLNSLLFKKAQSVDISCYETPEFYNTYTKAAAEASGRAENVLSNCAGLLSALTASIYVIAVMVKITPWALLFIALPLIANLYFGKKLGKVSFDINEAATPDRRRLDYVNRIMYFRKYAGELRLTNIYTVLENMFKTAADGEAAASLKFAFKNALFNAAKGILMFLLGYEGMWLCAAILAIAGKITLGGLIVLLNTIVSVSWMMNNFESSVSSCSTNAFFIANLKSFLEYTPAIDETAGGEAPPENVETLEFKNVSFKYKGQEKYALKNINLTMRRGVRHALVGINGSGKSTLIKLIMRYYDPTEGEILLNGINIKEFDIKKYRGLIGAAFQDFALFAATVTENVLMGEPENNADREKAVKALKDSDVYAKIETLDNKENTILTREFDNDGAELSGGEKQKIAIARAFAKNAPIVLLDEPSSALDPIAEYKMFETVTRLCKGDNKLSVIVSHRLSSAAMCERLFVFKDGKLLEEGTHKELLQKNGLYADMFYKQARNYTAEEVTA